MHEGFRGYVDINAGNIIPISLLAANQVKITASGLRFRSSPSLSGSEIGSITCTDTLFSYTGKITADGYTWYQISYNGKTGWVAASSEWLTEIQGTGLNTYYYRYSTGNLLHRYAYHTGTTYTDSFMNLGPTPTYLNEGTHYYSFDSGIYLYTNLTTMLDDYRNNTYTSSLNADNPNYPYYLFMPSKSVSKITAEDLNKQITNPKSKLYNQGAAFKEAEKLYGMNALTAFAKARTESSDGMSAIAQDKNNVFGYGAYDSCAYNCAKSYDSVYDSIMDYAKNSQGSYTTAEAVYYFGSHPGTKGSGRNVKYASNPLAGELEASQTYMADLKNNNLRDYKANTIGVTKFGKYNVPVYKEANTNTIIYRMQNNNSSLKVYDVPVTVIDKVGDFYKIYTDSNSYQYGYVKVSDLNVSNNQPVISATDKTIALNSNFNILEGVSASDVEDGNLTSKLISTGTVNTAQVGTYPVTYTVTDSSNFSASKTVNITVKGASEPVIIASDKEVSQYTSFDPMEGVKATDATDGDITNKVTYTGTVDIDTKGEYKITYSVTNNSGKTAVKTITVKVVANEKPEINATDKTIYLNSDFDPKEGVTAQDKEDGDLTSKLEITKNEVKTDTIGDYKVEYSVTDNAGQTTTKEITITVTEKVLQKVNGTMYLDYIKEVDNQLQLKGYNTIEGINNNLDTDITYSITFKNVETGQTYEQDAIRIEDKTEMTRPIPSLDGKDYTYSWFKIDIDLSKLPQGNYFMTVTAKNSDYYSANTISNKLNKTQDTSYAGLKYVITRNNYNYEDSPVELIIRDEQLAPKEASSYYNQYDIYRIFEFTADNKLHLRGLSYSYGANLAGDVTVERKLIFENKKTFETYTKDLGSVTDGNYQAALPENDGLDKTRAWYDKNIDLSDIPAGDYIIYITTKSNIVDIAEFTEKNNRSLADVKATINGKEYSFKINFDYGNRIEMSVK